MKILLGLTFMLSIAFPVFANTSCNGVNEITENKKISNTNVRLICIEGIVYIFSRGFGADTVEVQVLYSKDASESGKLLPKICDGNHVK